MAACFAAFKTSWSGLVKINKQKLAAGDADQKVQMDLIIYPFNITAKLLDNLGPMLLII
jgi:hypothetical protein